MTPSTPEISVVIPARDEVVAITPLVEEVGRILHDRAFEVIVIDRWHAPRAYAAGVNT